MSLPPAWKIKRELYGAYDQIKAWIFLMFSPLRQIFYDRRELKKIQVHDGARILQKKLILYLIFQPRGLLESNFTAIESFISQGYEVLVVSNGNISDPDIHKLRPLCWRILIRENLGYDFGGYRCGLHYLKSLNVNLDDLNLINDSVWYPIISDNDFLHRIETIVSDFGGAVFLEGMNAHENGVVLSYWITIKASLFKADDFWKYWKKYIPSGNKTLTVKLGERGISRQMNLSGRKVSGVFTRHQFLLALHSATAQQLKLTLKYAALTDLDFETECGQLLDNFQDTHQWRSSSLEFIERVVRKRNFLHSFCYPSVSILRVPFIKKNTLRLQLLMRQKYLQAVYAGDLPSPGPCILQEIEKSVDMSNQLPAFR